MLNLDTIDAKQVVTPTLITHNLHSLASNYSYSHNNNGGRNLNNLDLPNNLDLTHDLDLPHNLDLNNLDLNNHDLHINDLHINASGQGQKGMEVAQTVKVSYLVCLSVAIVLGNSLVILSVLKFKDMHSVTNYFLVSLASADLMVGVMTIPLFITWLLQHDAFLQPVLCNAVLLGCLFVMVASQLNVIVVTSERYTAVCHPFLHRKTLHANPGITRITITMVWFTSAVATCLSSLGLGNAMEQHQCSFYRQFTATFLLLAVTLGVFIPFIIIFALNVQILAKVHSSQVFIKDMMLRQPIPTATSSTTNNTTATTKKHRALSMPDEILSKAMSRSSSGGVPDNTTVPTTTTSITSPKIQRASSVPATSPDNTTVTTTTITSPKIQRASSVPASIPENNTTIPTTTATPKIHRTSSVPGGNILGKATVMVVTVCCLFLLIWTPFFLVVIVHAMCDGCHLRHALDVILLFAFTGSALNPLVYGLCCIRFRRAYRKILTSLCCRSDERSGQGQGQRRRSNYVSVQLMDWTSNRSTA